MHKHFKTQRSEGHNKSLGEFFDKDRSTAPESSKKRKLEAFRQTSPNEYKSMKLLDIKDSKTIKVHKKKDYDYYGQSGFSIVEYQGYIELLAELEPRNTNSSTKYSNETML